MIQDTCDHVVARRLRTRVEKSRQITYRLIRMLATHRSKVSANSPEEVRRRREGHELTGIEVLHANISAILLIDAKIKAANL